MSVAAMTLDDQRPLMNSYDKMSTKYDQNLHNTNSSASSVIGGVGMGVGGGGVCGSMSSGGPLSGPASPTPSVSEEPTASHHSSHHHHHSSSSYSLHPHHLSHHHHSHHVHHAANLQQQQQLSSASRPSSPTGQPAAAAVLHQDTVAAAAAIAAAEQRQRELEDEIETLKMGQSRLTLQFADAQRREKILMRRLANKEQEFQDYVSQIAEYKAAQAPSAVALRSALLDPAVNLLFQKLKKELKATKAKLEETQNELSAWKFTPDSNTGKRLMAKCRLLYQENEELGKMTSNGRLAKLETELAMQKSFSDEVKKSQSELDDFLQELDEDVEGMQSTILFLQQELKTTRDQIQILEKENFELKNGISSSQDEPQQPIIKQEKAIRIDDGASDVSDASTVFNGNIFIANPIQQIPTEHNFALTTTSQSQQMLIQTQQSLQQIDDSTSLHPNTTTSFFNGTEDAALNELIHEGNGGGAIGAKLRTVASRKRNYECDVPIMDSLQTAPIAMVSSPRTLPPKKSKLRVTTTPMRRTSIQSIDENEILISTGGGVNTIVDNAVDGMANEEISACVDPLANDSTVNVMEQGVSGVVVGAQRILSRRRSVRLNGASNGGGGGSCGDSNH